VGGGLGGRTKKKAQRPAQQRGDFEFQESHFRPRGAKGENSWDYRPQLAESWLGLISRFPMA